MNMPREIVFDGTKLNDYKKGRISGMVYILAGMPKKTWGWGRRDNRNEWVWFFECPEGKYNTIVETIESVYPGVIIRKES